MAPAAPMITKRTITWGESTDIVEKVTRVISWEALVVKSKRCRILAILNQTYADRGTAKVEMVMLLIDVVKGNLWCPLDAIDRLVLKEKFFLKGWSRTKHREVTKYRSSTRANKSVKRNVTKWNTRGISHDFVD